MSNGKISQFFKDHWRGIVLVIGTALFCTACLYCCKNGAELSIRNNKIIITKTKTN